MQWPCKYGHFNAQLEKDSFFYRMPYFQQKAESSKLQLPSVIMASVISGFNDMCTYLNAELFGEQTHFRNRNQIIVHRTHIECSSHV